MFLFRNHHYRLRQLKKLSFTTTNYINSIINIKHKFNLNIYISFKSTIFLMSRRLLLPSLVKLDILLSSLSQPNIIQRKNQATSNKLGVGDHVGPLEYFSLPSNNKILSKRTTTIPTSSSPFRMKKYSENPLIGDTPWEKVHSAYLRNANTNKNKGWTVQEEKKRRSFDSRLG